MIRRRALLALLGLVAALGGLALGSGGSHAGASVGRAAAVPRAAAVSPTSIGHVFVIVLENESATTTFGPNSPAPYLSQTLRGQGAYVPNYYGIGHNSNDNYIAMISGQAPNTLTQQDCSTFSNFPPGLGTDSSGQQQGLGCVYPGDVPTIASQLTGAGLSWRDYNEDMGANPTREASVCGHPAVGSPDNTETATATDEYATRHNPFVYFHGIIDNTTLCDTNVVNLTQLPQDLTSPSATPNYVFITPNLCNDGHDAPCKNGDPGGLAQADRFLQTWVPQITGSPAFRQDGLLLITFDEAETSDSSSCCGEIAGPGAALPGVSGPGGGQVGAVMLSPCIAPGTATSTAYNHYSMLRSVEDIFKLPHLAYANLPGETSFGGDVFNAPCGPAAPTASIQSPPLQSAVSSSARIPVSWLADTQGGTPLASYTIQVRDTTQRKPSWRTLLSATQRTSLTFRGSPGHTYVFSMQVVNTAGQASATVFASTLVPSGAKPAKARFSHGWKVHRVSRAWQGHAIISTTPGSTLKLRFSGGSLSLIGEKTSAGGAARVTIDGRSRTVRLHSSHRITRLVIFSAHLRPRVHHLEVKVVRGTVALEGVAIDSRLN